MAGQYDYEHDYDYEQHDGEAAKSKHLLSSNKGVAAVVAAVVLALIVGVLIARLQGNGQDPNLSQTEEGSLVTTATTTSTVSRDPASCDDGSCTWELMWHECRVAAGSANADDECGQTVWAFRGGDHESIHVTDTLTSTERTTTTVTSTRTYEPLFRDLGIDW